MSVARKIVQAGHARFIDGSEAEQIIESPTTLSPNPVLPQAEKVENSCLIKSKDAVIVRPCAKSLSSSVQSKQTDIRSKSNQEDKGGTCDLDALRDLVVPPPPATLEAEQPSPSPTSVCWPSVSSLPSSGIFLDEARPSSPDVLRSAMEPSEPPISPPFPFASYSNLNPMDPKPTYPSRRREHGECVQF